jgi:DMSO/TMAO reductase YedYZ molybdopterin-dependent catalytic subunit
MSRRTLRSFAALAALSVAALGAWQLATRAPKLLGAPAPFRRVLEWNGSLWHGLFDPRKLDHYPPPPPGKRPRFNGDLGLKTPLDLERWRLRISSDRGARIALGLADLKALPEARASTLFYCIEGWSDPLSYAGVRFSDFLRILGLGTRSGQAWDPDDPASAADLYRYVGLATPDGQYYVSIDMESMLHPQTLLAYEENGLPLAPEHGAPLRLVIPVKYGIKSLKRIGSIVFSDRRPPDYWAERGYDWFAGL